MDNFDYHQPDVTLLLDMDGVIREATFSGTVPPEDAAAWLGLAWCDTVEELATHRVSRILEDARASGISAFRQLIQRFPSGAELPMEYTTVLLGGRAGLLAVGKNLQAVATLETRLIAAQQTLERDYWKLREVETRYRLLFDSSNEAVVVIDASTLQIIEANPAAIHVFSQATYEGGSLIGSNFMTELLPRERTQFLAMLFRVRDLGKSPGIILHLGLKRAPWAARASQMPSEHGTVILIQLVSAGLSRLDRDQREAPSVKDLIERIPDGFVIVNADGIIYSVNQAFLDLVQVGSKSSIIGESIGRWMWRPGVDFKVLRTHMSRHGAIRLFSSTIHGELGTDIDVEISAAGSESHPQYVGIFVRDVSRRLSSNTAQDSTQRALTSIFDQVGRTSLRKIIRETVGVVEQHHIKAALELANGNRSAAAEILGLSRQSLYAKLDRYNLGRDQGCALKASD